MVTKTTYTTAKREHFKKYRPGRHSKNRSSSLKTSKNYLKPYVGQGKK